MESLRPNEPRAKIAIALIWIMLSLYILMGISSYFEYRLLLGVSEGELVTTEAAEASDSRQMLIAIVNLVFFILSIVTFIMWFRRAYYNLHLRAATLEHTEGWAAGSWFVPFVNLYRPYQIMKELYVKTYALLGTKSSDFPKNYTTAYLGLWWLLWILNGIVDRISFKMSMGAETIEALMNSSVASVVSCAVGIPLALVTVKVISDYAEMEQLFARQDLIKIASENTPSDFGSGSILTPEPSPYQ